jgi:hypothetical protein
MGRTGFGGRMIERWPVTRSNRSDAPEQTNERSYPWGQRSKDDGRDFGRTHPYIGCASVRPFCPSSLGLQKLTSSVRVRQAKVDGAALADFPQIGLFDCETETDAACFEHRRWS